MIFVSLGIIIVIYSIDGVHFMILSSTTNPLCAKFGKKRAIEILAKAGFDAVDLSLIYSMRDENDVFNGENYREEAEILAKVAKENGVFFNQAHAYFPTSFEDEAKTEIAVKKVIRCIEIASIVGADVIVVHPQQHLYYNRGNNPQILKEMNLKFYSLLMPYCEKYGVKVATENMWQRGKLSDVIVRSTCSEGNEFCEYVDMVDSEYMTACLDLGHCGLTGQLPEDMIRELGNKRLGALHVHDNDGKRDNHVEPMAPFISSVNWEEVCKALAEIDYQGDFTFEAENIFSKCNEYTVDSIAKHLHDIGRYLIGRIEYYKNV